MSNQLRFCLLYIALTICDGFDWKGLNLPDEHIPYYFTNNPDIKSKCQQDAGCPYQESLKVKKCWGYEDNCPVKQRMGMPSCPGESRGWIKTNNKAEQLDVFWKQGDFGYIKEKKGELKVLCKPQTETDSSLECVRYTRYCKATNLYMDFTNGRLNQGNDRFREDVFKDGEIGGHCQFNKKALAAEGEHKSPLQSWYAELEHYTSLPFRPIQDKKCDIVIEKPAFLIKLDAGINLYHHFCDFINLYTSQHINNSFSTDVNIIMWDTSPLLYRDLFEVTWKAFSDYPVTRLHDYDGKKVCFKQAVFPLLARMRYGMYYNMPMIPGCEKCSLFRAFNQHITHRLNITQDGPLKDKIRITLLSRSTKYRKILNEDELVGALKTITEYEVQKADFNWNTPFIDQMKVSHNSDIFIGIHGAGLTHMLFQSDWAVVMEIYNCEDEGCYRDLAKLRGIKYMTWENSKKLHQQDEGHHPTLGAHAKFTNYGFDVEEFLRLVSKAADHVRSHAAFKSARKEKFGNHGHTEL